MCVNDVILFFFYFLSAEKIGFGISQKKILFFKEISEFFKNLKKNSGVFRNFQEFLMKFQEFWN
jgi:hypothetical protein